MLIHPDFDPVAFSLGPLQVRWYGLMYLLGFIAGWALGRYRVKQPGSGWTAAQMDDLVFYIALGVILGVSFGIAIQRALADDGFSALRIPWLQFVVFLLVAGLVGVLASVWPGRRAARMQVLDAIAAE